MNLIIQTIIGTLQTLKQQQQITTQMLDTVCLQWFEADRRIIRTTTTGGREIAFRLLKEGQRLHHEDVVYPLFLDGNELLLPFDKPLFEWLQAAGFAPTRQQRRLSEQLRANSAPGVGGGHSHAHSHNHHITGHHHH